MTDWKTHTPKYDGHAPDDLDGEGMEWNARTENTVWPDRPAAGQPNWLSRVYYRYRAKQSVLDALTAQCLALSQADRDALIAELQKPVRDWADDVYADSRKAYSKGGKEGAAAVIRSMCLSNHDPLLTEIFNFIGGIDGAAELRGKLLKVMRS